MVPNASASTPSRTPADFSADMALGGSGHADTINPYPTCTACFADLRDHAVRLMKRRDRHGLRRCCDGQKDNADEPDHPYLRCEASRTHFLEECINSAIEDHFKMMGCRTANCPAAEEPGLRQKARWRPKQGQGCRWTQAIAPGRHGLALSQATASGRGA